MRPVISRAGVVVVHRFATVPLLPSPRRLHLYTARYVM